MNAHAPPSRPETAGVRVLDGRPWSANATWHSARHALDDPSIGLVLIPRAPMAGLAEAVEGVAARRVRGSIGPGDAPMTLAAACRELGLEHEELWTDCTEMATRFFTHFEPVTPKFRLELIDEQPCPRFHCDHVFVRLLCTHCGPTTEYCTLHAQDSAHAFGHGWIGLLKGSKHPAHDGVRVLHRSPPMAAGDKRLSFALDW